MDNKSIKKYNNLDKILRSRNNNLNQENIFSEILSIKL